MYAMTAEPLEKWLLEAHGETVREYVTIKIPPNLRILFFYDPDRADTEIWTCSKAMPKICADYTNEGHARWIYNPGLHRMRNLMLSFKDDGMGFYKCERGERAGYTPVNLGDRFIGLQEAIARFVNVANGLDHGSVGGPENPPIKTDLYMVTCSARGNMRSAPKKITLLHGGGGRRLKRKHRTHRRRKNRRTRRHR